MTIDTPQADVLKKERWYVLILAAIQFAHILDFVIMMPLGPNFMRVFGISPIEFSTLVSAYTFSAGIVGFFGALYADHFDRKKFLLFNFAGFIVGTFMCAIAPNFAALLTARIIAGAFGGILNAGVLSLIADLIPFQRRGTAMSVVMSSFSVSSIIGVPLGLYIANIFDWHGAFYFIVIISAAFWILALMKLPSVKVHAESKPTFVQNLLRFKKVLSEKDYLQSFSLTSILAFGLFTIIPFISPYMVKNVGLEESDLPLMYLVGGIGTIIAARITGKLSDKIGSFKVFRVIALISLVPIMGLTTLPAVSVTIAIIVSTLFTMFGSSRFIPAMTIVSAVVKPQDRGTFMSLENASRQLSMGFSSQVAGIIIGTTSAGALTHYGSVGLVGVVTTFIAIYIAFRIKNKFNLN